jgi:pilus assembly protein FimV
MALRPLVAIGLLVPALAAGAELGRLTLQSAAGEPLRAEIEVLAVRPGEAATLAARIPPPEVFWRANLEPARVLDRLRVAVERRPGNRHVVVLRSAEAVDEPFLQVLVELVSATGSVVREYPFLLEESRPRAQRPGAEPVLPGAAGLADRAPRSAPPARLAGDGFLVRPGDTLASIAQAQRFSGVSLEQAVVAIYLANEQAFLDANLHRLPVGQRLVIPDEELARTIDPEEARRIVLAHSAAHAGYRRPPAGVLANAGGRSEAPRAPAERDRLSVSQAEEPQRGAKAARTVREDDLASVQRALADAQERIRLLEKSLDDVRVLLVMKDQQQLARTGRPPQDAAPQAGDAAAAGRPRDEYDPGMLSRFLGYYGGWIVLGFIVGFLSWVTMPLKTVRLWHKKRRRRRRDLEKHARRVRRAARKAGLLSTSS